MSDVKMAWRYGALALVLLGGVAGAEEKWKTVEDDDGIVIKVRPRTGGEGKEIWAEGDLEASAQDIQGALTDSASMRLWMPYVKESRVVSTAADGSRVVYLKLDFPVVDPRDYTITLVDEKKVAEDGTGEFIQRWTPAVGVVPERKGVVRLNHNYGSWQVTPKGEGKAHVVYKFTVDPGGSVPGWLASFGQSDAVMETLEAVKKRAKKLGEERKKAKPAAAPAPAP